MWSGPRNISTAMMRAWGARPDTFVCDEPLYAHYLHETGLRHPGADEVIRAGETDWRAVAAWLTGEVPQGKSVFFQKHMAHHLLPNIGRDWLRGLTHAFLIRNPHEMLCSLAKILPAPGLADTGLPQQLEILELIRGLTGVNPPVLDSKDVLDQPERMLRALCRELGIDFTAAMLRWEPGPRATDGVWAKYWYHAVEKTTSFVPYESKREALPEHLHDLHTECQRIYDVLYSQRLRGD